MLKKVLTTLAIGVSLAFAPSALAEELGAEALSDLNSQSAWTDMAQPSEPLDEEVTPVATEELQVVETTDVSVVELVAPTELVTENEEPVVPVTVEPTPAVQAPVVEPQASTEEWDVVNTTSVQPEASLEVSPKEVTIDPTPVVEEPETVPTEVVETSSAVNLELAVEQIEVVEQTQASAEVAVNVSTGDNQASATLTVPVSPRSQVVTTVATGREGNTSWQSQEVKVQGVILENDDTTVVGTLGVNNSSYQGGDTEGNTWAGSSTDLKLGVTAEHRPDNFTLRGEASVSLVTGQGSLQGTATYHVTDRIHVTGSVGSFGRSAQAEFQPTDNTFVGVNTVRGNGDRVSYQSVFAGFNIGGLRVTANSRGLFQLNFNATF